MDSVAGYCERCGSRFGLLPPQPGAGDLGVESVKSVFRYCVRCSQFVGRGCCWNPDAVACTTCVPKRVPGAPLQLDSEAASPDREALVRFALAELKAATAGLGDVAHAIEPPSPTNLRTARTGWDAAWWATAWLVIRAESSRDAASKLLWRPGRGRGKRAADDELRRDVASYETELRSVETSLIGAGRRIAMLEPTATPRRRSPSAWRRALVPIAAAALLVVAVVGIGSGAIDRLVPQLDGGPPAAGDAEATASERGAVLGGGPSRSDDPAVTPTPAATATPDAASTQPATPDATPDAVLASIAFDTMRMGALEEGSGITDLAGHPEVVSFPSPFDRSVRVAGDGSSGFCVATQLGPGAPVALTLDLYPEVTPGGSLQVVLPAAEGHAAVSVPLELLAAEPLERWYRASISWPGNGEAELVLTDVADGRTVVSDQLQSGPAPASDAGSVCVSAAVATPDGGILLDNLTIEG